MLLRLCVVVLLLVGSLTAQVRYVTDQPGVWRPWNMTAIPSARAERGATPAELKAFEAKLIELSGIARAVPAIGQPVGFTGQIWGSLAGYYQNPGQPAGKQLPLVGSMDFGAFAIYEYERDGKTVRTDKGETTLVLFVVNDLQSIRRSRPVEWEQQETDAVLMPAATGAIAGFPLISGNIVVKKNPKPLTVPLSLEQALQLVLPNRVSALESARNSLAIQQADLAEWQTPAKRAERKKGYREASDLMKDNGQFAQQMEAEEVEIEAAMKAILEPNGSPAQSVREAEQGLKEVQAMLASLSPAEAAGPGCYDEAGSGLSQRFLPAGAASCVPLVRPNWDYFDPRLPRSAPQLIVVSGYDECLNSRNSTEGKPWGCAANRKLLEGLDWPAILNWLDSGQ